MACSIRPNKTWQKQLTAKPTPVKAILVVYSKKATSHSKYAANKPMRNNLPSYWFCLGYMQRQLKHVTMHYFDRQQKLQIKIANQENN